MAQAIDRHSQCGWGSPDAGVACSTSSPPHSVAGRRSSRPIWSARSMARARCSASPSCGRALATRSTSVPRSHIIGGGSSRRISSAQARSLVAAGRDPGARGRSDEDPCSRRGCPIVYRRIGGAPPASGAGRRLRLSTASWHGRPSGRGGRSRPPGVDRGVEDPAGPDRHDPERGGSRPAVASADASRRAGLGIDASAPSSFRWARSRGRRTRWRSWGSRPRSSRPRMPSTSSWGTAPCDPDGARGVGRSVSTTGRMLGVRGDVGDLLSLADALLFASRPDGMEGMPASLIEAGMLGTPPSPTTSRASARS